MSLDLIIGELRREAGKIFKQWGVDPIPIEINEGLANCNARYLSGQRRIEIAEIYARFSPRDEVRKTLHHELAHYVSHALYGRPQGHSADFRGVMYWIVNWQREPKTK